MSFFFFDSVPYFLLLVCIKSKMLKTVDKYSTMASKTETNVKNVQRLHFVGLILQQVSVFGVRNQSKMAQN